MPYTFLHGDCDDRGYVFEILFERAPSPDERKAIVDAVEIPLADSGARLSTEKWLWHDTWAVATIEWADRSLFGMLVSGYFHPAHRIVPIRQIVHLNAVDDGEDLEVPEGLVVGPKWDRWLRGWDYEMGAFAQHEKRVAEVQSLVDDEVEKARTQRYLAAASAGGDDD